MSEFSGNGWGNAGSAFLGGLRQADEYMRNRRFDDEERAYRRGLRTREEADYQASKAYQDEQRDRQREGWKREDEALADAETMRDLNEGMLTSGYDDATRNKVLSRQAGLSGDLVGQKAFEGEAENAEFDDAMRRLVVTNGADFQPALDYYNRKVPDGYQASGTRDKDGNFILQVNDGKGGVKASPPMSLEQFGRVFSMMREPKQFMEYQTAARKRLQEVEDEQAKRQHDLNKIDREYGHKKEIESIKDGGSASATNAQKQYLELINMGVPHQAAQGVAYGTFKTVTDPGTGAMVLLDVTSGAEVGRMLPRDPGSFNSQTEWVPAGQQPTVTYDDARKQAQQEAADKAGWLSTDSSDFGDEGRRVWIDKRAKEIMAESAAQTGRGLPIRQEPQSAAPPQPRGAGLTPPKIERPAMTMPQKDYSNAVWATPKGNITYQDVVETAKKYGMTPEQVMEQAGLQ